MSAYRTAPGVTPVRIHTYPKRRPNFIRDARITAIPENTDPARQQLDFDLSYADFLQLTNEQVSVSA